MDERCSFPVEPPKLDRQQTLNRCRLQLLNKTSMVPGQGLRPPTVTPTPTPIPTRPVLGPCAIPSFPRSAQVPSSTSSDPTFMTRRDEMRLPATPERRNHGPVGCSPFWRYQ